MGHNFGKNNSRTTIYVAGNFQKGKLLKKAEFKGLQKNNFENQLAYDYGIIV